MIKQGTLLKGLAVLIVLSLDHTSSSTNWNSSFFSASTTRTLRT